MNSGLLSVLEKDVRFVMSGSLYILQLEEIRFVETRQEREENSDGRCHSEVASWQLSDGENTIHILMTGAILSF